MNSAAHGKHEHANEDDVKTCKARRVEVLAPSGSNCGDGQDSQPGKQYLPGFGINSKKLRESLNWIHIFAPPCVLQPYIEFGRAGSSWLKCGVTTLKILPKLSEPRSVFRASRVL